MRLRFYVNFTKYKGSREHAMKYCILFLIILFPCIVGNLNHAAIIQQLKKINLPGFDVEGHRGCRGIMPENTIPAMLKALDIGVTTLELDVVITRDKQVMVSHEPFYNHELTTRADGTFINAKDERKFNIYEMEYAETVQFDVGSKTHPRFPLQAKLRVAKPRLSDLIDSVESYVRKNALPLPYFNIETKSLPATDHLYHPPPGEFVNELMKVIIDKKLSNRVIIQSFDFRTLQVLHRDYPHIKTAVLISALDNRDLKTQVQNLGFTPTIYSPEHVLVNELLVKNCKAMQLKLVPWTVNEMERIIYLIKIGVDGIITDFPGLFTSIKVEKAFKKYNKRKSGE